MIKFEERPVVKVQLNEVTMEFICRFYQDASSRNIILIVYNDNEYFTNIAYEEICRYSEEKDLMYFLKYLCREKDLDTDIDKNVKLIFKRNPSYVCVLVKGSCKGNVASFYTNTVDICLCNKAMQSVRDGLRTEGVSAYLVVIPDDKDILKRNRHPEWDLDTFAQKISWAIPNRYKMEKYLHKITELQYEEARERMMQPKRKKVCVGEGESRTIFLVGLCIVEGWENFEGEKLVDILYEQLLQHGISYRVEIVSAIISSKMAVESILEHDIKKNDIVILINYGLDKNIADFDLTEAYNCYNGDEWLYSDMPVHTTKLGNEVIAEALIKNIIEPVFRQLKEEDDQVIVHMSETYEKKVLHDYLKKIKRFASHMGGVIGACVMTCNPFTIGHYNLIEYASTCVDFLYVFIVEEDGFYIPFDDRIEMVKRGIAHLNNVIVLPSGKYMISKETFKNYFEKEIHSDVVIDAAKDIDLFKKYISPALHITKRFVGEEPEDHITMQYNHLLKKELAGQVEVIEIPRKTVPGGKIISASTVRKYLDKKDWINVAELVPITTLEYLKKNYEKISSKQNQTGQLNNYAKVVQFIKIHEDVIICGMGEDFKELIWWLDFDLDIEDIDKLEFYDKYKAQNHCRFRGKKIVGFEEMIDKYRDYYMVIATRKYKQELFYDLTKNDVDLKHIIVYSESI